MLPTDPLPPVEKSVSVADVVRLGFGVLLLLLGLGGWTVWQVYLLLNDPEAFALLRELSTIKESRLDLVIVPREVWLYGIPVVVVSIAASLANTLIKGGGNLLSGNFERLQRQVTTRLDEFKAQLQEVTNQLKNPRP